MASSANYLAESDNRQIQIGYAIEIDGVTTKFSNVTITSGGGTHEENITSMSWNPPKLSQDTPKISVGTLTVTLIDPNETLLGELANGGNLNLKKLTLYRGYGNLAFADWNVLSTFTIYDVSSNDSNRIVLKARDQMTVLKEGFNTIKTNGSGPISILDTNITVVSTTGFPSSGTIKIEDELIPYSGTTATQFTGATRGANAAAYDDGVDVFHAADIQDNPIDIMLQLMISPGGGITGSLYDVLDIGLGIQETDIDTTSFEEIRDNTGLSGDTYNLIVDSDIANALNLFERELMQFTNTRIFINDEGKYALALFSEISLDQLGGTLIEEDVQVLPSVALNSDRVINQFRVKYGYDEELKTFSKTTTYNDTDSQAKFGVKPGPDLESRAIKVGLSGASILDSFKNKYFRRVAEPFGKISRVKTLWKKQFFIPGDKVDFTHSKIYDLSSGTQGITNQIMEVISAKYDFERGICTYEINNSPALTGQFVFISPSSNVASGVHSATVFDVEAGEGARAEWEAGQVIALWPLEGGSAPIDTATIQSVSTDTITLETPGFSTTPDTTHRIQYADYDDVTETQKLFAFWSDGSNQFPDGRDPYTIS